MIPEFIDNTETHCFVLDDRGGLCVLFASRAAIARGGVVKPLWYREIADRRTVDALLRWTAMRRDQWSAWGRLGEAAGCDVLNLHIQKLLDAEPIAEIMGTALQVSEDPCGVALCEMLSGKAGPHFEVIHSHTFESTEARDRFYAWLHTDENMSVVAELAMLAYNFGTNKVSTTLEKIANLPIAETRQPRKSRQKQLVHS